MRLIICPDGAVKRLNLGLCRQVIEWGKFGRLKEKLLTVQWRVAHLLLL